MGPLYLNCTNLKAYSIDPKEIQIVLELANGGDVSRLIKREKNLQEKTVVDIMSDVSRALVYIHGKNLIHRDLKPQNILIFQQNPNTVYKLADLGIARELASTMSIAGSLDYMASEIRNREI